MGLFAKAAPAAKPGQSPAAEALERELRVAYGHMEKLQKVNTQPAGCYATYVLAYWQVRDRIATLEREFNRLKPEEVSGE